MLKAGLIGGVVGFIYIAGLTLISPFCAFCVTPWLGLGVGYLAAWFDQPRQVNVSLGKGVAAGGLAGLGGMVGQIIAAMISSILITHFQDLPLMMRQLGLGDLIITDPAEYWQAALSSNVLCGLLNWGMVIGLGAVGGLLWWQRQQRRLV